MLAKFCGALFVALLASGLGSVSRADNRPFFDNPPIPRLSPRPGTLPPLNPDQTYIVDIDCRKPPGAAPLHVIEDNTYIYRKRYTTSHGILISTAQAAAVPNGTAALPSTGLGMALVYLTDGTSATEVDNRDKGCSSFVVRRQAKLFLIPFISLHSTFEAGFVASVFSAMLTPFTSLFALIAGGPLASSATARITDFQTFETQFNTALAKLNQDFNYAASVPLGVGRTTVTTDQSVTTVTVRPVSPSLINDPIDKNAFENDLRKLGDSETSHPTAASPGPTCTLLGNQVALDGIYAAEDQAYIMGIEALKAMQTNELLMQCFGKLVKVAARVPQIFVGQQYVNITPDMADDYYANNFKIPSQLSFQGTQVTLDSLMTMLGRYTKNKPPAPEDTSALKDLFVGNPTLTDNTRAKLFTSSPMASGFPSVIDAFVGKGYYHFGCYIQTDDHTGLNVVGANSIFLGFKAPADANSGKKADTLAIFPIVADSVHKIQSFEVTDNTDWISSVLNNRDKAYNCNGFTVN